MAHSGRVNHRGWIVRESVASVDGGLCVDFFEDPGGGFGFEHFRADPEDGGRWTAVGGFSSTRYGTEPEAQAAAIEAVRWLRNHVDDVRFGSDNSSLGQDEPGGTP